MSKHGNHQAGTVSGCAQCVTIAYEPSWYAAMLAFAEERNLDGVLVRLDDRVAVTTLSGAL